MIALAIDQSMENTGWARGSIDGSPPVSGAMSLWRPADLVRKNEGAGYLALRDFLIEQISNYGVEIVFFEQSVPPRNPRQYNSTRYQLALEGILLSTCSEHNIPAKQVPIASWRHRFIGTAKAPPNHPKGMSTEWFKNEAIQECLQLGWMVDSHDEAEACGILHFGLCTLDVGYERQSAPLFRRNRVRAAG